MDKGLKGIINGLILGIIAWALIIWGACNVHAAVDWDGDGYTDCICGELKEENQCAPCIFPITIVAGKVLCEDGSPAVKEPVIIQRKLLPFIKHTMLTGEKGIYWDFVMSGLFDVTVRDETRLTLGLPDFDKWSVKCVTTTTSICQTCPTTTTVPGTTTVPKTTSTVCATSTTTLKPNTTSVPPVTTSAPYVTTSSVSSTSVRPNTTTIPVTTSIPSTTTTIKEKKPRCELICKEKCGRKPFDIIIQKIFPKIYAKMIESRVMSEKEGTCYQECMWDCTPLDK